MENDTISVIEDSRGPVWTTQKGREIPVTLIDDSHLANIINFIRRRSAETFLSYARAGFHDVDVLCTGEELEARRDLVELANTEPVDHKTLADHFELTRKMSPGREPVVAWNVKSSKGYSTLLEDPRELGPWHALAHATHKSYRDLWSEAEGRGDIVLDELIEDGGEDVRVE